jgi:hypothetical protein
MNEPATQSDVQQMDVDEAIRSAESIESNRRQWIKTLTPLLEILLRGESRCLDDVSEGAVTNLIVAACARARRECRADVAGEAITESLCK